MKGAFKMMGVLLSGPSLASLVASSAQMPPHISSEKLGSSVVD